MKWERSQTRNSLSLVRGLRSDFRMKGAWPTSDFRCSKDVLRWRLPATSLTRHFEDARCQSCRAEVRAALTFLFSRQPLERSLFISCLCFEANCIWLLNSLKFPQSLRFFCFHLVSTSGSLISFILMTSHKLFQLTFSSFFIFFHLFKLNCSIGPPAIPYWGWHPLSFERGRVVSLLFEVSSLSNNISVSFNFSNTLIFQWESISELEGERRILRDSSRWDLIESLIFDDEVVEVESRSSTEEMVLTWREVEDGSTVVMLSSTVTLLLEAIEEAVAVLEEASDEVIGLAWAFLRVSDASWRERFWGHAAFLVDFEEVEGVVQSEIDSLMTLRARGG